MDFLKDLSIDKVRNLAEDAFNQAKPKTEVETRVYEVLSHKNWGSSSTLMNDIARDTFDYDKFAVISQITWESLENQRPAAWRIVFKGLTLLEYLIKNGSERCVDDARNHGHTLRALHQFNYYEGTVDRGSGVREKSKQLRELLSDDERIREERQKARKLREKFGGNLGGVSGGGGGGRYAGYGNDDWSSPQGGGGGYGEGGIGSETKRGGRYDNDSRGGGSSGYSGRYDDEQSGGRATSSSQAAAPTFASLPDEPKKTKTKKKKKKQVEEASAPEPAVDLFSFDAPAPAPAPAATEPASEEFGTFHSTGGSGSAPANDPFAAPAAPAAQQQQGGTNFDAFGTAQQQTVPPMQQQNNAQFNAFGNTGNTMNSGGMMQQPQQQQQGAQFDAFGNAGNTMGGGMQQAPPEAMAGGGGTAGATANATADDDDFGDFADANPSKSSAASSSDPMSKLISLDGLSKNTKKVNKLDEPVIANQAAANFVQEKDVIQNNIKQGKKGSGASFQGIDGLQTPSMTMGMSNMANMAQPGSGMMNPNVMASGGASAISGMMDPSMMQNTSQPQQVNNTGNQQQQQQQGAMMNPQMMAGNPQMMMGNPQMMGGSGGMAMNPGMQQQGFGGMNTGGMQMTPQQQQQMMMMMMNNQQAMGGGMQQGMGGQQQQGGGSNMGGFR